MCACERVARPFYRHTGLTLTSSEPNEATPFSRPPVRWHSGLPRHGQSSCWGWSKRESAGQQSVFHMAVARKIKTLLTVNILVFVGIILFSVYCRIQDRSEELIQLGRVTDQRLRARNGKVSNLVDRQSILQRLERLEDVVYNQLNGRAVEFSQDPHLWCHDCVASSDWRWQDKVAERSLLNSWEKVCVGLKHDSFLGRTADSLQIETCFGRTLVVMTLSVQEVLCISLQHLAHAADRQAFRQ